MKGLKQKINELSPRQKRVLNKEVYTRMNDRDWFVSFFPSKFYANIPEIIRYQILEKTYNDLISSKDFQSLASP